MLVWGVVNLRTSPAHLASVPQGGAPSRAFTLWLPGPLEDQQ